MPLGNSPFVAIHKCAHGFEEKGSKHNQIINAMYLLACLAVNFVSYICFLQLIELPLYYSICYIFFG